ncbi:hypothetical protein HDK77DRAFT_64744 [Phyllosticta capitalensis]|uniref:Uncharacterized protein n=1 Tax=Phyllosticta capitalensis TaxID=121624 RepID=A0ABR1YQY6_9PEZI
MTEYRMETRHHGKQTRMQSQFIGLSTWTPRGRKKRRTEQVACIWRASAGDEGLRAAPTGVDEMKQRGKATDEIHAKSSNQGLGGETVFVAGIQHKSSRRSAVGQLTFEEAAAPTSIPRSVGSTDLAWFFASSRVRTSTTPLLRASTSMPMLHVSARPHMSDARSLTKRSGAPPSQTVAPSTSHTRCRVSAAEWFPPPLTPFVFFKLNAPQTPLRDTLTPYC